MNNFWRNKKVIVTGANGFLGSHLTITLLKKGARVTGIIKVSPKYTYLNAALKELSNPKLKIIKSDIVNLKAVRKIFKAFKPDICLHVAAQPIVGLANKSPLPTFKANIEGTWNILEATREFKMKALVVASTDKAYGEHKKLPYAEDAALLALHPYDSSKACADILTRCYAHTYGLNTAVTRCANIYGPGDLNFSRIIPDTIRSAIFLGKNPIIRSDGTPLRDYVYIDDIVNGYLLLAEYLYIGKVKAGEIFNFGTGKPVSVLGLVRNILQAAGREDLKPVILSKIKIKGEIDKQYLSICKARRTLGWKPRLFLSHGLAITIDWYKQYFNTLFE